MDTHLFIIKENVLEKFSFLKEATIFIYGSHVTGTFHPRSDLDLLILTKEALDDDLVKKVTQDAKTENINLFLMSEKAFILSQNECFPWAAPLEEALRYGVKVRGHFQLKKLLTPEERLRMRWTGSLYELSQRKYPGSSWDLEKTLVRSTFLLWELEGKSYLNGYFSLGLIAHRLMSGELPLPAPNDPLVDLIQQSHVLWDWINPEFMDPLKRDQLEAWAQIISPRLKNFRYFIQDFHFDPLPQESLKFIQGHPLFAQVSWRPKGAHMEMDDQGRQFTINFAKNCLA